MVVGVRHRLRAAAAAAHRRPRSRARAGDPAAVVPPIARAPRAADALDRHGPSPARNAARAGDHDDEAAEEASEAARRYLDTAEQEGLIEGEERRLLQSIVDFGDTLVREVMTPRPDIVAHPETRHDRRLRALFREQEYSRFPVYKESLDNIAGFVFVKDLVALGAADDCAADHGAAAPGGRRAGDASACRSC